MGGGGRKRKRSTQLSKGDAKAYNTERRHLPIRKPRRKLFNRCHTVQVESCVRACTYIRTKVCWRPHYRLPEVVLPNYSCKSKVAQLGLWERTAGGKQHVLGLQVTMDHILGVEVAEGCQNLREKRRGEERRLDYNPLRHFYPPRGVNQEGSNLYVSMYVSTYLVHKELCESFGEFTVWTAQDELQHVAMHLLHDNVDLDTRGLGGREGGTK